MNAPLWYAAGASAFMVVLAVLAVGWFRSAWRKTRDNPEKLGDDWDPFS
jgi:hypothetical protein